jgi:mannose-6-phosphate isomerase-like protein (cupin superfamily)
MHAQQTMDERANVWRITLVGGQLQKGGERFDFCTSARTDPEGKFRLIFTLPPGKKGPTEHAHPGESETLEIVSGNCRFWVGSSMYDCGPGDVVTIPADTKHRMHNRGKDDCVMRVTYSGSVMEDVFVPAAVALKQQGLFRAFMGMIIWVADKQPTRPSSKLEVLLLRAFARIFKLIGGKSHQPVLGWDQQ